MQYRLKQYYWLALCLFLSFPITSCKKDCTPPKINQNIIGTWTAVHQVGNRTIGPATVVFNADGTMTDNDDFILVDPSGVSLNEKSWMLEGSTLQVQAGGTSGELRLAENRCDFISFEVDRFNTFLELSR